MKSSLVGIGSRRQVDGLDEEIVEINCGRSMSEKQSRHTSGSVATSKVSVLGNKLLSVGGIS